MIIVAFALTLFPEFLYLRDLFGTRMNTVFKFYYQAWALLALASAYGLSRLAAKTTPVALKVPAVALSALLILGGLWYPLAAIPSKADNFQSQPTLDGLAYLQRSDPAQVAAIDWLRANVPPDAVVLEATGGSYSDAARVSMATGNPTLLGWDFHERQWRGNQGYDKLASMRPGVIDQIYRSAQPAEPAGPAEPVGRGLRVHRQRGAGEVRRWRRGARPLRRRTNESLRCGRGPHLRKVRIWCKKASSIGRLRAFRSSSG